MIEVPSGIFEPVSSIIAEQGIDPWSDSLK